MLLGLNEARTAKSPAGLGGASGIPTGCEVGLGAGARTGHNSIFGVIDIPA